MIFAYAVRHAPRNSFVPEIPNSDTGLTTEGKTIAEKEMGPALRKDIDGVLTAHPGEKYSIEVFYSPALRTKETKDLIANSLNGLENITYKEEPALLDINMGGYHALPKSERAIKYPTETEFYHFMKDGGPSDKMNAIPPGQNAESVEAARMRFDDFLRDQKLEDINSSVPTAPLKIKIFVTHGLICNLLARNVQMHSGEEFLNYEKHPRGSIRRFSGATMHIMADDGFIYENEAERIKMLKEKYGKPNEGKLIER